MIMPVLQTTTSLRSWPFHDGPSRLTFTSPTLNVNNTLYPALLDQSESFTQVRSWRNWQIEFLDDADREIVIDAAMRLCQHGSGNRIGARCALT